MHEGKYCLMQLIELVRLMLMRLRTSFLEPSLEVFTSEINAHD